MLGRFVDPCGSLGEIRSKLSLLLVISLASTLISIPLGFLLGVRLFGGLLIVLLFPAAFCFAKAVNTLKSISVDSSEGYIRFYKGHFILLGITLVAVIADLILYPIPATNSFAFPKLATSVGHRDLFAGVIAIQLFAIISFLKATREASRAKAGRSAFATAT